MKTARKHPTEEQRLQALKALQILDTVPEKEFDDITLIASEICGTSIAAISLIDETRQWFKAKRGMRADETPRETAFCSYTILEEDALVVPDATKDARFCESIFVTNAGIRFYAGIPLMSPGGFPVGTLFVVDRVAKTLTDGQLSALKALSGQVTSLLRMKTQNHELEELSTRAVYKKTMIENLSEGMVLTDNSGKIIECNPAAAEILGLENDSLLVGRPSGDPVWRHITQEGQKFPAGELPTEKCLRTGEKQANVIVGIYLNPAELCWLNVTSTPLFLDAKSTKPSHVITSFTNITEIRALDSNRRYLEAKLTDSGRLSALGEMAGGIAHEINNPLAVILGKTHLLKQKLENGSLDQNGLKDFEKIEATVERIAKIIKSLKLYSRNAENDPIVSSNLSNIIQDTLELCSARFRNEGIEVQVNCDPEFDIECRSAQISQLLMNLLNNAYDAVHDLPKKWVRISVENRISDYVFTVTDSGEGIPEHVVPKIMQPFYSTKELGKGMGLGLSTALGIAEAHQGTFEYDRQSQNTKFVLTLPKTQDQAKRLAS
ncbi:MAG: domain S-box protein [Pseudobdellovibrio sp.]|nr:domain S-box protein [Pseudobdellovibrio sp.]